MSQFNVDELRLVALSAPVLLKMLKGKEDRIVNKIYGEFRNGKVDHLTSLAELACVRDLIHEVNAAVTQLNKQGDA